MSMFQIHEMRVNLSTLSTMLWINLSLMRSDMGAMETRLNQVISKQIGISEQTTVSRSRIEDADYALEAARLSKTQVIQQAGASVLVQANEITRMAIELLKR